MLPTFIDCGKFDLPDNIYMWGNGEKYRHNNWQFFVYVCTLTLIQFEWEASGE